MHKCFSKALQICPYTKKPFSYFIFCQISPTEELLSGHIGSAVGFSIQYYFDFWTFFLKYLSVGSMIKFWNTTFWLLWKIKHQNHATFMNQKVVFQSFIIEPTDDKYFSDFTNFAIWECFFFQLKVLTTLLELSSNILKRPRKFETISDVGRLFQFLWPP